jgi:hypothetical protein
MANTLMTGSLNQFALTKAPKSRSGDHWSPDNYDVRQPSSVYNRDYTASREQAMRYLKARYTA